MQSTTQFHSMSGALRFRPRVASALFVAATAATLFAPADASAQFRVCNRTGEEIAVAISYRSNGAWLTRGWFNTSPGKCVTPVGGSLQQRFYYVHGQSSTGTWGGDRSFCIDDDSAFRYRGTPACSGARQVKASFTEVDTGMELSYTLNLTTDVSPAKMHAGIDAVRVTWRESLIVPGTYVIRLYNGQSSAVSFRLRCFTKGGGYSQTFPVTLAAYGSTEIGFLEGWVGNFVAGERCEAYHANELAWSVNALSRRNGG